MQYGKILLTLLIIVLGYKLMIVALPLMNKPSDRALYVGATLLITSVAGTSAVLRLLWRRSESHGKSR